MRDFFDRIKKQFGLFSGHGQRQNGHFLWLILPLLWMSLGIVIIQPYQEGVMLTFGKITRRVSPGPSWNWPWPIGQTIKVDVMRIKKIEVGFRTTQLGPPTRYQRVSSEALMITGDENIVSLEFIVQYKINNPMNYRFRDRNPEGTLHDASEAVMREVIGEAPIDLALTEGKGDIQTKAQTMIQALMDQYDLGIQIVTVKLQDVNPPDEVSDAFKDVINAQQDKERKINEAKGFENDLIPAARGEAAEMINKAQGYKEARVTEAQGEAERFISLLREYRNGKNVTTTRLYLETMEEILPTMEKTIIDQPISQNTIPYLPLNSRAKTGEQK